jgi:hypothetical protein
LVSKINGSSSDRTIAAWKVPTCLEASRDAVSCYSLPKALLGGELFPRFFLLYTQDYKLLMRGKGDLKGGRGEHEFK